MREKKQRVCRVGLQMKNRWNNIKFFMISKCAPVLRIEEKQTASTNAINI